MGDFAQFIRDDEAGDRDALEGSLARILTDPNFKPSAYMTGLARTGRGLTRTEADAIRYRQEHGPASRQFLAGGALVIPRGSGGPVPVRVPGPVYYGEQQPDETVNVAVGPEHGFDSNRRFGR